ncbi:MAG: superoxide dismutase [Nanoarchaeota archaeon]
MKYTLPKLPYAFDSLEPFIDAKTMEIHHTKHHQAYVDKLNDALSKHPEIADKPIEELLKNTADVPEDIRTAIKNHGGGHVNHSFFWKLLKKEQEAKGKIISAIEKEFGSLDKFKEQFTASALGRFGSGWVWLVLNRRKLEIYSTGNQDSPLMENKIPLLGLDIWEHSYYLKHMWNRKAYVEDWWNVVNWKKVEELYESAIKNKK